MSIGLIFPIIFLAWAVSGNIVNIAPWLVPIIFVLAGIGLRFVFRFRRDLCAFIDAKYQKLQAEKAEQKKKDDATSPKPVPTEAFIAAMKEQFEIIRKELRPVTIVNQPQNWESPGTPPEGTPK